VAKAAQEAGVDRFFYMSHLGADRASAYAVLKAKAIAEEHIRRSGVDYTILRSAIVYGPNDGFTTGLARLLQVTPFVFLRPGEGDALLQPLWVEDLVTCMVWALDDDATRGQVFQVGGPEFLTFNQVVAEVMSATGIRKPLVSVRPSFLIRLTRFLEHSLPRLPVSVYWLEYLATNHTCSLDSLPHAFNLMPARFSQRLAYLKRAPRKRSAQRLLPRKQAQG
jgi:NADH dehydrogenase